MFDTLSKQIDSLARDYQQVASQLNIEASQKRYEELLAQSEQPDFWQDNITAQTTMKQIAKLQQRIEPWQGVKKSIDEVRELIALGDDSLATDLQKHIEDIQEKMEELKTHLKYAGPYDDHDVIVGIYAGAGGTDAQDWAQMLLRMYTRYAEKSGYKVTTIEQSPGEEAGIKSIVLDISGDNAYAHLKGEHGVHRLVRLSPFNADNLRQTSFAKVEVMPKIDQPDEVVIDDKDLKVDVYRSGGHGGQSVNTTDSAVRITHLPTGITVAIQNERSQLQNKETALGLLRSRLAQLQLEQHAENVAALKGPNQSAEWGNQIRNYVLHPYKLVKDLRTGVESSDPDSVLDGQLEPFSEAYLQYSLGNSL